MGRLRGKYKTSKDGKGGGQFVSHEEAAANPDTTYKVGTMSKEHPLQSLMEAADGLWFPSETDASFGTLFYPSETPDEIADVLDRSGGAEVKKVDEFFDPVTRREDWHTAADLATLARWRALRDVVKATLENPRVLVVGQRTRLCYILGGVDGGCGGLQTYVVET